MSTTASKRLIGLVALVVAIAAIVLAVTLRRAGAPPGAPAGPAELTATLRSEPRSFNRFIARDRTSNLVSLVLHGKLVRVNLATQDVEPSLAERWEVSPDGRTWTFTLREGVRFADGTPFTPADVLFSLAAAYDEKTASPLAESLMVNGAPLAASAPDDRTVVFTLPASFGPGVRLLDNLPILPKHKLGAALEAGTLREMWGLNTPPAEMTGLGPFVVEEYRPGERLVFARNPHYWGRDASGAPLPRLDRLVMPIVADQATELLRLEAGEADLVSGDVRPDDLAAVRKAADAGRLQLVDLGVGLDPDALWFNLSPVFARDAARRARPWLQRRELRQAIALAVDRQAMADTVYLGAAVPVAGPVTPGNHAWHDASIAVPPHDPARAKTLLASMGLVDRNGDGALEGPDGKPARFALLTQKGSSLRERAAAFLQQELQQVGLGVDVVTLDQPAVIERITNGDYEAIWFSPQASDTDPASNLDVWLSSGPFHFWNPVQETPATEWERRIDELMRENVSTPDQAARKRAFDEVQRVFAEEVPALYFVAPKVTVAMSRRVTGARPGILQPFVMWSSETLGVAPASAGGASR
jgi:peptide/nickel transport system substrate-binding protein